MYTVYYTVCVYVMNLDCVRFSAIANSVADKTVFIKHVRKANKSNTQDKRHNQKTGRRSGDETSRISKADPNPE